jgi:hypothetical protein
MPFIRGLAQPGYGDTLFQSRPGSRMPAKLSNQLRHERLCAFTHVRVAWFFVALCALEVYSSWKALGRPISPPASLFDLLFYVLVVVVYAPIFLMIFRCFSESFIIVIATVHIAMAVVSWFAPGLFDPYKNLIGWAFVALWITGLVLSLNMAVQAIRNPFMAPEGDEASSPKKGLLILGAVIVIAFIVGLTLYWIPSR